MNKYTLGPWNCTRASAAGRNIIVSDVLPLDICVLSNRDKTQIEIDANARLIAAAPDLLDALRPFEKLLQTHNNKSHDDKPIFAINDSMITIGDLRKARAAIAKAEGKA